MTRHLALTGAQRSDRLHWIGAHLAPTAVARCHRRLRGPYTGLDTALAAVLPDAAQRWPELVEQHRVELLYGMPELTALIGAAPSTLASESPFYQRTRFFGAGMIRCMSQGIVTFLLAYARQRGEPLTLAFDEVDQAEATTQEFLALLVRRADPALLRVVVCGADAALPAELAVALGGAEHVDCPAAPREVGSRSEADLAAAYVTGDGTSDDPAEIAAYEGLADADRRALHDERAEELTPDAGWELKVGAIAYHREHGSDPGGAGREALKEALLYCVQAGFSAAVADIGERGRAVTDPVADQRDFCIFTNQMAVAMVPLGRLEESHALYLELRQRYAIPKVHMSAAYALAMLYTRFFTPRDHDAAVQWENTAIAIASNLPDPRERLVLGVFQDNAMALIEMHRGNLARALELVEGGITRLDAGLRDGEWVLHRSQLQYNRARLLLGLRRLDEAYEEFSALIEVDPYYTDYLSERARISRKRGDLAAALADYDRAVELAPPFPELYYNRGTARADAGDLDGAFADFRYVLEMEPTEVDTRLAYGELLLASGAVDTAAAQVRDGLVLQPDEPRLRCLDAAIELERGNWRRALDVLDPVLAADPGYPAALLNRAVAHYELGHHAAAVADLTATLASAGEDPDVLLNRGIAHLAAGRPDLALADFDHALRLPGADQAELHRQLKLCGAEF
jgi:tetratricopeptide (TPR) repeat protein